MTEPTKTRDLSVYADKAPTSLHEHFTVWIKEKTGIAPSVKDVQLAVSLYADYQASPENKARAEAEKVERELAKLQAKTAKKGGPRSPEARELKDLLAAKALLEKVNQPVPAKTTKRIAELEAELAKGTDKVEVPEQKSDESPTADERIADKEQAVVDQVEGVNA